MDKDQNNWRVKLEIVLGKNVKNNARVKKKDKQRWITKEILKIARNQQEAKAKADKIRIRILKAVFQQLSTEDKSNHYSNQCKEKKIK